MLALRAFNPPTGIYWPAVLLCPPLVILDPSTSSLTWLPESELVTACLESLNQAAAMMVGVGLRHGCIHRWLQPCVFCATTLVGLVGPNRWSWCAKRGLTNPPRTLPGAVWLRYGGSAVAQGKPGVAVVAGQKQLWAAAANPSLALRPPVVCWLELLPLTNQRITPPPPLFNSFLAIRLDAICFNFLPII